MEQHKKLYPPITTEGREENPIGAYICKMLVPKELQFMMVNLYEEEFYTNAFDIMDIAKFFETPMNEGVKAYIFNMFELQQMNFPEHLKRQETIIRKLRQLQLPYYFITTEAYLATMVLVNANITSGFNESVIVVCVLLDELIVIELIRKTDGYLIVHRRDEDCENETNYEMLKDRILGTCRQPKKIIVSPTMATSNMALVGIVKNKILKSMNNVMVLDFEVQRCVPKFVAAVINHMSDKSNNEYHVFPRCHIGYAATTSPSPTSDADALIIVRENEVLPLEKSVTLPRMKSTFYLSHFNTLTTKRYEKTRTSEPPTSNNIDYHKLELTLIIDESNVPFLYQERILLPEIEALPSKLDEMEDMEMPVIGFFDNSAVICIKVESGYKFLDSWNGLYGNDLFLSFEQEKPTLITQADAVTYSKTTLKASDILKVMTMPADNIIVDPKWNFTTTSDSDNPVLLEFQSFDGTSATASPAFLMAIIIKELVRVVRKEVGRKPKKIGICIFDAFERTEIKERVETGLQEACILLKHESQILLSM